MLHANDICAFRLPDRTEPSVAPNLSPEDAEDLRIAGEIDGEMQRVFYEGYEKILPPEERCFGLSERERDVALAVEEVLYERKSGLLSSRHVEEAVPFEKVRRESSKSGDEAGERIGRASTG
ncbi:MAG: hypothetical protein OXF02_01420 [Simkaniaceae bacterium]|nr:hypothetical protein [Simkaniaceae bacterium]